MYKILVLVFWIVFRWIWNSTSQCISPINKEIWNFSATSVLVLIVTLPSNAESGLQNNQLWFLSTSRHGRVLDDAWYLHEWSLQEHHWQLSVSVSTRLSVQSGTSHVRWWVVVCAPIYPLGFGLGSGSLLIYVLNPNPNPNTNSNQDYF